ncbi:hypothetical protein ABT160_42320 [Streptomyces sp. NPDC001941]|uniref:hypothetical protein n=1 Tax=Streptomyces sp. NPDC001941 TaxID=3154659 RepID=UPI003317D00B
MDLCDDGAVLDEMWDEHENNLCGLLPGRSAGCLALRLVRAGWTSRSSSWEGYEIETSWCRFEAEPDGADTLLSGFVVPHRLDDLAAALTACGLSFTLELHNGRGRLLREKRG